VESEVAVIGIGEIAESLVPASRLSLGRTDDAQALRRKIGEFVGLTFFAPMLKQASESKLKGKYGHGGRGEEVFRGQLNELLAQRIGESGRFGLVDELFKRLSTPGSAAVKSQVQEEA
jgi:hypothetical protein